MAGESSVRFVATLGMVSAAIAAAVSRGLERTHHAPWAPAAEIFTRLPDVLSPFQKLPPGPVYLLAYGGLALVALSAIIWADEHRRAIPVLQAAALVGRTSLFVFVLQYYVNFVLVPLVHWPDVPWWPVYFALSLAAIYAAASYWSAHGLNRLISVGYPASASPLVVRSEVPTVGS